MTTTTPPQSITLDRESRVIVAPSVYARSFGNELVLLDFARGEYFGLDEIGAHVWRGLQDGQPLRAIAATIVVKFEVDETQAFEDVVELTRDLCDRALISIKSVQESQ